MYGIYKWRIWFFGGFHTNPLWPDLWGLPLPIRHPQISILFCEKGRKRRRNYYMKPFPTLSFVNKAKLTKILEGCNNHPPGRKRVKAIKCFILVGAAIFGATFHLITRVDYHNKFWNTKNSSLKISSLPLNNCCRNVLQNGVNTLFKMCCFFFLTRVYFFRYDLL